MAESQVNIQLPTENIVKQLMNRLLPIIKEEISKLSGQSEDYYTTGEVCRMFKISESTLIRRRNDGLIKFQRMGRSIRYPKSQFAKA